MSYPTIADCIGNTPLVQLAHIPCGSNRVLLKLEGNNPAGSVKDRAAFYMLKQALNRGTLTQSDVIIEATSGNTGIALAMAAATLGLKMRLIMPKNSSQERIHAMRAYGAELILVEEGMEQARDLAAKMQQQGEGKVLNQFANMDNPQAHFETTAPEIWQQTGGKISHFVSAMGTTGTIVGCARFFKMHNAAIQIIGVQPEEGSNIAGIRKWAPEYLPQIYSAENIDAIHTVSAANAEACARQLAQQEGICAGVSAGGALYVALQLARQLQNATIVSIVADRGDRYLSTGIFG